MKQQLFKLADTKFNIFLSYRQLFLVQFQSFFVKFQGQSSRIGFLLTFSHIFEVEKAIERFLQSVDFGYLRL